MAFNQNQDGYSLDTTIGPRYGANGQVNYAPGALPAIPMTNYDPTTGAWTAAPGTYTPPASAFADPTKNQNIPLGSAPAAQPGMTAAPTAAYLQSLLGSSQYANNPQAAIAYFNQSTGRTSGNEAVYYDPSVHGTATIGLPDSYLSLNGNQWGITQRTPESSSGGTPAPAPASSTPDPQTQALIDLLTKQQTGADTQQAADQQKANDLYAQLQGRANQALTVNPNDPVIAAQTAAYNATQDRSARNYLGNLAEQSGPYANLQGQQRIVAEQTGQNDAAFQAQLLGSQLTSQRQDIADALNGMRGMLSSQQQNDLQAQLGNIDAAIKQQSLAQSQNQFGQSLGYQYANLGQQGTQFGQNLANQQDQFTQNIGFQYSNQDQQLLQLLLSGLGTA